MTESSASKRRRYDEQFKRDAVRLVTDVGYSVKAAAAAVGVTVPCLRGWRKRFGPAATPCGEDASGAELKAENARLRRELREAQMERPIAVSSPKELLRSHRFR